MPPKSLKWSPAIAVGTLLLVVATLYWARPVLIPVALALLLAFLLSPVADALQRLGLGRGISVALLAMLTLSVIGAIGWATSVQIKDIARNLPGYQGNLKQRIQDLQVGQGTTVDKIRLEFEQLIGNVTTNAPTAEQARQPVLVTVQAGRFSSGMWQLSPVVRPLLESLCEILLVAILVIFMLLERDELRHRAIRLLGYGRLSLTTQALDEAGQRVSRYLFAQFIVNASLGVVIGLGLFLLGVPYALLWGFLIILLRFVPYLGIGIAALLPFAISLATSATWWQPLSVLALFAVLEPVVALIIEPLLFSQTAGVSKLAMLIALAFWTWLWGPVGLLLATPLTACLAVVAKHVPQLEFIAVLLGDEPLMQTSVAYYQRLLAWEADEAEALVEEQLRTHPVGHVFDEVLVPALHYAKRDHRLGVLATEDRAFIYQTTREIIERIGLPASHPTLPVEAALGAVNTVADTLLADAHKIRILAWPADDEGDAIALLMLQQLLDPTSYEMELSASGKRWPEILEAVAATTPALVCVGMIPPGGLSASRHLSQRLRARYPELTIVVGQWGLHVKDHQNRDALLTAGATYVAATLSETRDQIEQALHPHVRLPPEAV